MSAFLTQFEETKKIYGFCPCCGELFRLSDVTIFTKTPPPPTPFDRVAEQQRRLEQQSDRFDEQEDDIRDKAKAKGQREASRHLKKIAPYFFGPAVDLNEVKLLFDPVEYIVFKGLRKANCSSVEFVDHPPETKERELIQHSLAAAIQAGNIEWQTFRVENSGRIALDVPRRSVRPAAAPAPPVPTRPITPPPLPPATSTALPPEGPPEGTAPAAA